MTWRFWEYNLHSKSLAHIKEKICGAYLASVAYISAGADSREFTIGDVHGLLLIRSVGIKTSDTEEAFTGTKLS